MSVDAIERRPIGPLRLGALLAAPPLWLLCVAGVAGIGLIEFAMAPFRLATLLGDPDDATRLVEVRRLMQGAGWFDLSLPRFGAGTPLVSHWSRLIDLPLALLIGLFGLVLSPAMAELVTRALWPLLLLVPLVWLLARDAEIRSGRTAGLMAIALALLCLSGRAQFALGRIDHHNAQILGVVGGSLLLAQSFARPANAVWAGILLGLGLAVGYEGLPIAAWTLAVAALLAAWTGQALRAMATAASAFAAALAGCFLLTVAPWQWSTVHCDALAINIVLAAVAGSSGLIAIAHHDRLAASRLARLLTLAATGGVALVLYAVSNPVCLGGQFAEVDKAIVPIWLDEVLEARSVVWLWSKQPILTLAWLLTVGVGGAATIRVLRQDRDAPALLLALTILAAVALSFWQLKLMPYASFLMVPPVAVVLARLAGTPRFPARVVQLAGLGLANQISLTVFAALIAVAAIPVSQRAPSAMQLAAPCVASHAVGQIRSLPKGRVVADIELGPYIVALTDHDVLAAPYHRMGKAIASTHAIHFGDPTEAESRLRELGADYVAVCAGLPGTTPANGPASDALRPALLDGRAPSYLETVMLDAALPIKIWRMRK